MPKIFDPIRKREIAEWYIDFLQGVPDPGSLFGNKASMDISASVWLSLVGFHKEVRPVIRRARQWLELAITNDEKMGVDQNGHRMTLHWARALVGWLEDGWNFEGEWNEARIFLEALWRSEKHPWSMHNIIKYGLDDYMAFAYQAGEHDDGYEAGVEMYERWTGLKDVSLHKALKPREFGYALCLHHARLQFDPEDLYAAGRRLLKANLQSVWFGYGQFNRGATWLKIVHTLERPGQGDPPTPLEILLKAYEDMPDVVRPEGV